MGKSRRNRGGNGKGGAADPLAKPKGAVTWKPVKVPANPELAALRERRILPVLRDLQSSEPKQRSAAAAAVAHIVQDADCRRLLLREKIVRVVLEETLTDASLEGRAAGWEILRVLAAEELPDFCVHLYRVDVVTAVQHAARKVTETLTTSSPPFSKTSKIEQNFVWSIAEALTALIDQLAEAHDEAFDAIAKNEDIVHFLFVLLSIGFTTATVSENAMNCILTLSEDNRPFVEAILADETTKTYDRLISFQRGGGYKAVLACGILHNIFAAMEWHDQNPGRGGASDAVLVPTLSHSLEQAQSGSSVTNGSGLSSPAEILQLALEILASIGTTLQESLEKSSKEEWGGIEDKDDDDVMDADAIIDDEVLSENEEPDDKDEDAEADVDGDDADEDDDDEMDEDEMEADMEMVTGADDEPAEEDSGIDDLPTLKELLQRAVPQALKIAQQTTSSSDSDEETAILRGHAFATLNNIAWTISCIDFSGGKSAPILRAWRPIARTIWRGAVSPVLASDTSDIKLATVVTSLAWALARTLHYHDDNEDDKDDKEFLAGSDGEHKKFISLYQTARYLTEATKAAVGVQEKKGKDDEEDPFQTLDVRCVGVLGQLALDARAPLERNREIGAFLLETVLGNLLNATPTANAVEALNQLFDIYGGDGGDEGESQEVRDRDREVFWKEGFLQHFEKALKVFRTAVRWVDKRKEPELRLRAEEALMNLDRFIKYKQKHRPRP